jgi:phosphoglycerol transferase MdoB-like AlkP superfamily enzyme
LNAVQCLDKALREFFRYFESLDFANNTVVMIFGDHRLYEYTFPTFFGQPRNIFLMFPHSKPGIQKKISWYDVAPTLLEMVGIEAYEPHYPFGKSIFGSEESSEPTAGDCGDILGIDMDHPRCSVKIFEKGARN